VFFYFREPKTIRVKMWRHYLDVRSACD